MQHLPLTSKKTAFLPDVPEGGEGKAGSLKSAVVLKVPAHEVFAVLRAPALKFTRTALDPRVFSALNKMAFQLWMKAKK
jgi:hypothetical protein